MPLDILQSQVDLQIMGDSPSPERAPASAPLSLAEREALKDRLRSIVVEIVDEELERHRRSLGIG